MKKSGNQAAEVGNSEFGFFFKIIHDQEKQVAGNHKFPKTSNFFEKTNKKHLVSY
jgi:hypothetical protein